MTDEHGGARDGVQDLRSHGLTDLPRVLPDLSWLDRDTAERLLDGRPVAAVLPMGDARARAARLERVLAHALPGVDASGTRPRAAAAARTAPELPGEAAAVAAYRAARAGGTVLLAASAGAPDRRSARTAAGWARPVRFGLAAALAVCTVGGVAVAAGTGALPAPFRDEPTVAASGAHPRDPAAGSSEASGPAGAGSSGRTARRAPAPDDGPRPGGSPAPTAGGPAPSPQPSPRSTDLAAPAPEGPWSADPDGRARTADVCRAYVGEGPGPDTPDRRLLERVAGGAKAARRFCTRFLAQGGPAPHSEPATGPREVKRDAQRDDKGGDGRGGNPDKARATRPDKARATKPDKARATKPDKARGAARPGKRDTRGDSPRGRACTPATDDTPGTRPRHAAVPRAGRDGREQTADVRRGTARPHLRDQPAQPSRDAPAPRS
ncbi:hypothetical protein [Streptomyces sp. NPDC060194]|uniref:hypothetical protein n=1 Tax=Streptomyces sp. NPDC060194 TaxID=3347069 RepID=UPI0036660E2E